MKLNDKIRIKFFIVSLFLFSIHIVFTIPTLVNEDGFSERIFSINDLKMLTSLKGWYLFLLNIILLEDNYFATITCIPIVIGLILSYKEACKILKYGSLKILLLLLIIFEIIIFITHWLFLPFIAPPNF